MAVMTAATEAWRMASPEDMVRAVSASMRERTGKTVEEWVAIVADAGIDPIDHKAVRNLLASQIIADTLDALKIAEPKPTVDIEAIKRRYHEARGT